ncbi:MAG: hypothetical protein M3Q18_11680 [Actinomycetota bacterium]|nr:hypothetical protein [Actinomycetota bacterium]
MELRCLLGWRTEFFKERASIARDADGMLIVVVVDATRVDDQREKA